MPSDIPSAPEPVVIPGDDPIPIDPPAETPGSSPGEIPQDPPPLEQPEPPSDPAG